MAKKKASTGKKIFIIVLAVLALIIIAIAAVPLFYSIDHLRPQIVKQMEAKVRGKVELGKLSLSTFPAITVSVGPSKFIAPEPYQAKDFVSFDSAKVSIPLLSLLFSPHVDVELKQPKIHLISKNDGESNLTAFLPPAEAVSTDPKSTTEATTVASEGDPLSALPGFIKGRVLSATISVSLSSSEIKTSQLNNPLPGTTLTGLNLELSNIGLNSPMGVKLFTNLAYKESDISVSGPLSSEGEIKMTSDAKTYEVDFMIQNKLTDLDVAVGNSFVKKPGVAFNISSKGKVKKTQTILVDIEELKFQFGGLNVLAVTKLENLGEADALVNFNIKSDRLDLAGLSEFIPLAKSNALRGGFSFEGSVIGPIKKAALNIKLKLEEVSGKTPQLALPIEKLNGMISISGTSENPSILIDPFRLIIGSSDLDLKFQVEGVERPNMKVSIMANRFNVDELLGTQTVAQAQRSAPGAGGNPGGTETAPSTAPLDESLNAMAPQLDQTLSNPLLDKVRADVKISAKSMRMIGGEFSNARMNMTYRNRDLVLSNTGIDGYKGSFTLNGNFQLVPKTTGFSVQSALKNISLTEALKVHAPEWKNELSGNLNGTFNVSGRGLTKAQIEKDLRGSLKGNIVNGKTSIPVVKLIGGVLSKLPKKVQNPAEKEAGKQVFNGEFKTMKLDTEIVGRNVPIREVDIVFAAENAGLGEMRFQGSGNVNFDRKIDFTGTAFIQESVLGVKELKGPSGLIEIPLKFKGDMSAPSPDIGYSVGILGPRLAKGLLKSEAGQKLESKLKEEAKKIKLPEDLKKRFGF